MASQAAVRLSLDQIPMHSPVRQSVYICIRVRRLIPVISVSILEMLPAAVEDHPNRAPYHGYQEPGTLGQKSASAKERLPKDSRGFDTSQSSEPYKSAAAFNRQYADNSSLYDKAQRTLDGLEVDDNARFLDATSLTLRTLPGRVRRVV